jgi:hypothetical protein
MVPTCCRPRATTSLPRRIPRAAAIQSSSSLRPAAEPRRQQTGPKQAPRRYQETPPKDLGAQRGRGRRTPPGRHQSAKPVRNHLFGSPRPHAMTSTAPLRTSRASRLATTPSGRQGAPGTAPASSARRQDAVIRSVLELPEIRTSKDLLRRLERLEPRDDLSRPPNDWS